MKLPGAAVLVSRDMTFLQAARQLNLVVRPSMKPEPITLSLDDRRLLCRWAGDCARRVLRLFEAKAPADARPREAIEGSRGFARGGKRTVQLRNVALAALAAAREVGDPSAAAAARAAASAATTAYAKALAASHHAKHALGPAVYAALARELAADNGPGIGDKEIRWAIDHASPAVRDIVSRWPAPSMGRTRLNALYYQLDTGLRVSEKPSSAGKRRRKKP